MSFTDANYVFYDVITAILLCQKEEEIRNETLSFFNLCQSQMPIMSVIRAVLLCQKEEEVQKVRPANTCFNCLGDHMMNDCPEPRDQRKIIKNRKEFQSKTAGFNSARWDEFSLKINLRTEFIRDVLISDILVRIRIRGSVPLTNGSGSVSYFGSVSFLQ